jgi:hypothetical protein
MKGISPLISYTLILAITLSAIFIALQMGGQAIDKEKEILTLQEGKNNLFDIDNYIKTIVSEGQGSARLLRLSITAGEYYIDSDNDAITFYMGTQAQIIGINVSKTEDAINIVGESGKIYLNLSYSNRSIDITGQGIFGEGKHSLSINNDGYNTSTEKQMVSISVV